MQQNMSQQTNKIDRSRLAHRVMCRLEDVKSDLHSMANSLAGDVTGNVAVQLHGVDSMLYFVNKQLEAFRDRDEMPEWSTQMMVQVVLVTKQMSKILYDEEMSKMRSLPTTDERIDEITG